MLKLQALFFYFFRDHPLNDDKLLTSLDAAFRTTLNKFGLQHSRTIYELLLLDIIQPNANCDSLSSILYGVFCCLCEELLAGLKMKHSKLMLTLF